MPVRNPCPGAFRATVEPAKACARTRERADLLTSGYMIYVESLEDGLPARVTVCP
jgi:hypothetical protein